MKQTIGNYRWRVVSLLFFATTLNYVDRSVLGLLKPVIATDLGWTEIQYGYIVSAFSVAYGLGLLLTGVLLDRYGTKAGYVVAVSVWSIACSFHAFARSVFGFGLARFMLGVGESVNFPAAVKSVSEWFPKKERALANGWFNSGSNVGAFLAPVIVSFITVQYGWRWAFIVTGALGTIWVIAWFISYRLPEKHPRVSKAELEYIVSDSVEEKKVAVSWIKLITDRRAQAFCIIKVATDWVWWFLLFWTPDLLNKMFGADIKELVIPLVLIYTMASIGGIGGGWLSSTLIKRGKSINFSRKIAMLISAFIMLSVLFIPSSPELWVAVLLLSLSTAAHQGWSSNVFAIASDIYPKHMVGSVVSLGGFAAAIANAVFATLIGLALQITKSYTIVFLTAGTMYFLSWFVLKLMVPVIGSPENAGDELQVAGR